ncbi:MAG TPA: YbaY family lipoprotein [Candidatus Eisenbacteria bacterium]|nr:YbaY family lipoprotein [Candidatus Eisenbacteria bacterium]
MRAVRSWCGFPWLLVVVCVAAPLLAGSADAQVVITGTATYRERIALARDAVFEATLEDISRADAPAEVIARARRNSPGQVPIAFELDYDPRRLEPRGEYLVRAIIREGGQLRFTGTVSYAGDGRAGRVAIIMHRAPAPRVDREPDARPDAATPLGRLPATFVGLLPCVDCVGLRQQINLLPGHAYMQKTTHLRDGSDQSFYELGVWSLSDDDRTLTLDGGRRNPARWSVDGASLRKLDAAGQPIEADASHELTRRSTLEPMEPRVRLTGMFSYMADAARFRDCKTGLRWPVDMSGDYRALERAYTARRRKPGAELMASVEGRIEMHPRTEGEGREPTLVVEEFVAVMPDEPCEASDATAGLTITRWRPIRIGDRSVVVQGQQREPWIVLDPQSRRVSGSGGCNRISGSFEAGPRDALRFGRVTSTMMACADMETERAFLGALADTRRYRVTGRTLELLDARGRLIARLEERNLR